ncbi:amidohydrolase family protein [Wenxinia saemankumensis]|uniref:Predicted metal-dependent hydrolase, TIM-barrel fold n=1 Tax=Wenxinia saemankumensis TaxID=1447782 RepID=A0A1M6HSB8_9RHOB|nr:amidohydrolase family protein [Wenxinia saemankumensis]SHJ25047.1 Predicted metal-dependent hydrolase, TIM-barrel fold [Wenxinia saemankumensis]
MSDGPAWDTHVHVIGESGRFPLSPARGYEPPDAPLEALLAHLDAIGAGRAVLVQPSVYGFDNACLIDAIARSDGRCTGICVPDPGSEPRDLARLHAAGVRGLRCNLVNPGGLQLSQTEGWWPWMADHGWHLQVQIDASRLDVGALAARPGIPPLVVDHMGYPPRGSGPGAIASLVEAVADGLVHVKLSAPYRLSTQRPPYPDATLLARALLAAGADRCLFASDWPHTELSAPPMGDADWLHHLRAVAGPGWERMQRAAEALYGGA